MGVTMKVQKQIQLLLEVVYKTHPKLRDQIYAARKKSITETIEFGEPPGPPVRRIGDVFGELQFLLIAAECLVNQFGPQYHHRKSEYAKAVVDLLVISENSSEYMLGLALGRVFWDHIHQLPFVVDAKKASPCQIWVDKSWGIWTIYQKSELERKYDIGKMVPVLCDYFKISHNVLERLHVVPK